MVGGSGFIGRFLLKKLAAETTFDRIFNLDLVPDGIVSPRLTYIPCDVRQPIAFNPPVGWDKAESWLINLAAVCREPGYADKEYFDTNVGGAEQVTLFANRQGFRNLLFTSTMSTYGRMSQATPETARQYPETPYGISKAIGEKIHETWLAADPDRRLIICRPGVIFGPGDVHNIPRMINAIRKGYFVFPGNPDITKAYGYVYGLLDSLAFTMARRGENRILYNYAENPLLTLRGMAKAVGTALGKRPTVIRLPNAALVGVASVVQAVANAAGFSSPIHPVRVRKVAFPTHMHPEYLIKNGFEFRFPFDKALAHWRGEDPAFFGG